MYFFDLSQVIARGSDPKLFWSPEGTSYNGPYEEAPHGRGTFYNRLQVYEISVFEVYERVGKSVILV